MGLIGKESFPEGARLFFLSNIRAILSPSKTIQRFRQTVKE